MGLNHIIKIAGIVWSDWPVSKRIIWLNVNHPHCVYNKLKMQVFSVKTQLYCFTDQLHVSTVVSSHHQAVLKNVKIVKLWF